jgi:UDP-glucose 4-epimerase
MTTLTGYRARQQRKRRVLLTGIAGNLGRAVARRLHRSFELIGVDRRPTLHMPKDVEIETADLRRRRVEDIFRRQRIDAVVHLHIMHDPRSSDSSHHEFNIMGTQKLFELCTEHEVPKVIVLSSANVYGPNPKNDQLLAEDAPLMGSQHFSAIRDLVALDMFCNTFFWRSPEIETVILRPAHLVGRVDNAISRYLRLERPWTMLGFDPMLQLLHLEDLISAIELAIKPGVRGVYNLAGPPPVPLSYILGRLGRTPRTLPSTVASALLKLGWSLKLSDWPAPELEHLKYVCMVDDSLARRELGWAPRFDLDAILDELTR